MLLKWALLAHKHNKMNHIISHYWKTFAWNKCEKSWRIHSCIIFLCAQVLWQKYFLSFDEWLGVGLFLCYMFMIEKVAMFMNRHTVWMWYGLPLLIVLISRSSILMGHIHERDNFFHCSPFNFILQKIDKTWYKHLIVLVFKAWILN